MARPLVIAAVLAGTATPAVADDPAFDALEKALPRGWSMIATDSELVIRHDHACYITGEHVANAPDVPAGKVEGPLVTLELRYHLEAKWTPKQLADARAANDKVFAEVEAARQQYKIAAIRQSKGQPLPANADERARLAAFEKAELASRKRLVRVPTCTLGESSLFAGEETYAQLALKVDPPQAMEQAYQIVDLVKKRCGAN
jgi:hypothetical protein